LIAPRSMSRFDTRLSAADGVRPDDSMSSAKFRINIQFRNYKAAVLANARCRTSKIPMELSSFIQENFAAAPSKRFASVLT